MQPPHYNLCFHIVSSGSNRTNWQNSWDRKGWSCLPSLLYQNREEGFRLSCWSFDYHACYSSFSSCTVWLWLLCAMKIFLYDKTDFCRIIRKINNLQPANYLLTLVTISYNFELLYFCSTCLNVNKHAPFNMMLFQGGCRVEGMGARRFGMEWCSQAC
jgi:hypothetical protein